MNMSLTAQNKRVAEVSSYAQRALTGVMRNECHVYRVDAFILYPHPNPTKIVVRFRRNQDAFQVVQE